MKIKIIKNTVDESVIIIMDEKKNVVMCNDQVVNYDVDRFIFKVSNMVKGWPTELKDLSVLDGLKYEIIIKDKHNGKEEVKSYLFQNKFPEDIYRVERLISEISNTLKVENN